MKKCFLMFFLLVSVIMMAETIRYEDSWASHGFNLTTRSETGVGVTFSIENFTIENTRINGEDMQNIFLPGVILPNDEGAPNLPGNGRFLALPQGATADLRVVSVRTETYRDIEVAPAFRIPLDTEDGPLEYNRNMSIYSQNAFYPANPVQLGEQTVIRGVDAVMLGITPFQYNPVTKELVVYRDIELEVSFNGGNGQFGVESLRSRWWDPIFSDIFMNYASLPRVDYSNRNGTREGAEYLIISPNDPIFLAWADSIRTFRVEQGITTIIKTTAEVGGNTPTAIENYINGIMDPSTGWDPAPAAILLLGDYGTTGNSVVSPIYNSYCVSDNIYADVFGNNMMPDVILARMTAQNETHLQTMITKFLDYERTPPTNPGFYSNPITALGWQTERWFQICSETVGGYFLHEHGKTPVRINAIYSGTPGTTWSTATNTATVVNYFGPNGLGYIPATPAQLGGWSGGNATMVNNAINSGAFILQHRDHGMETGWGEPYYVNSDINGLTNTDLTFVFSINCLTGKYNWANESFTEKFHRYTYNGQNSGALGLIAASETSYSFVNDTYVWGMFDNMWPDFMPDYGATIPVDERGLLPAFGNAAGKYFLMQSSWPYNTNNKAVTYNLFHHHGDAFSTLYSEVPQNLTVLHDPIVLSGTSSFSVTADNGSLIALSVDGEVIGVGEGTGSPVSINIDPQIPPAVVKLVITKTNYYRYEAFLNVIPPGGPYVVFSEYQIDDSSANNNGVLDYGETVSLDMTLNNVGSDLASNVLATISSTDPYVTIIDGSESFGNIAANSTATVLDAFEISVANDVPNGHSINFELMAVGSDVWLSYFSITVHAPVVEFIEFLVDDTAAGNGDFMWDPGETVNIIVTLGNNGSSDAYNVIGSLSTTDPFITLITTTPQTYGDILYGTDAVAVFTANSSISTPEAHMAEFIIDFSADLGISGSGSFATQIGGYLIEEYFDSFPPAGWTTSGGSNWQGGTGNYAGGTAPEARFYWSPSTTAVQRLISNQINTTGSSTLQLEFKHNLDHYGGPYSIKVQTTSDGNTWNDAWSIVNPTGNIGPELVEVEVSTPDVGSSTFQIAWVFDGYSWNLNNWYVDDVILGGGSAASFGTLSGIVTDGVSGLPLAGVSVNGYTTTGTAGNYTIDLIPGTYDITFSLDEYYDYTEENVEIIADETTTLNVSLTPIPTLDPPNNFAGEVQNFNDVLLTWAPPGGATEEIYYHNGYDNNGIGTNGVADWICAARFTADELADYYGTWELTGVNIFLHSMDFSYVAIQVFEGGSFGSSGTLIYDQDITASAVALDFTNHLLSTPIPLVAGNEYWIGYEINATGDHPAAVDAGPPVAGKGDWMFYSGIWQEISVAFGLNYNWVINGVVTESSDLAVNRPKQSKTIGTTARAQRNLAYSNAPMEVHHRRPARVTAPATETTRALTGYTIYRDGTEIGSVAAAILQYLDSGLNVGTYNYTIVANYDDGDSDPAGPVEITVTLPAPTGVAATSNWPNIMVQWTAPSRALESYNIYQDGELVGTSTSIFYLHANVPEGTYTYNVAAVYSSGLEGDWSADAIVEHFDPVGTDPNLIPLVTSLEGNYPNPFNPSTTIKFGLSESANVMLEIYNIRGEKVRTLINEELPAKYHSVSWNGRDDNNKSVSSGVYFYKMRAGNYVSTRKMILMK